jgi:hypothetical protein
LLLSRRQVRTHTDGDPLFTDAVASIPRGFNRRGEPEALTVEGVVTGAS